MNARLGTKHLNSSSQKFDSDHLSLEHRASISGGFGLYNRAGRRTVSCSILSLLVETADTISVDLRPIIRDAGVTACSPQTMLPIARLVTIYKKCIAELHERATSEIFRDPSSFEDNHIFCSCLIHCRNLEQALATTINFFKLLDSRWGKTNYRVDDQEATFSLDIGRKSGNAAALYIDMLGLCFLYKLFSWLIGEPLDATKITLAHQPLLKPSILSEIVDCSIQFDAAENSIMFRADMLAKPILRTHRELMEALQISPFELMPMMRNISLPRRLEKIFEKALLENSEIPALEQIASALGQSSPTLRRHLAREGTSFQTLLDKCRMDRAVDLLLQTDLGLEEISFNLGFSAPSGFSRAFKDWTGYSPSNYRQMLSLQSASAVG